MMNDAMSHEAQHQIRHRRYYKRMDIMGEIYMRIPGRGFWSLYITLPA